MRCMLLTFLTLTAIVSGSQFTDKKPKAPNQLDPDQFDEHMQWIKNMRATFVTDEQKEMREQFRKKYMNFPRYSEDTRKKQEVEVDPVTGEMIDVETGQVIPEY